MNLKTLSIMLIVATVGCLFLAEPAGAQTDKQIDEAVDRSTRRMQDRQKYRLKYQMQADENLRWNVEQIATTEASIAGFDEKSSLRTRSVISWKVISVDANGNMTIQDTLESAVEWQKTGESEPISYDSTKPDEEVHETFLDTAQKIGKPISTTTIKPSGLIVQRESHIRTMEFGMGKFTLQLPDKPLAIGAQWNIPEELQARKADQTLKTIQTRMLYTLRKVENGLATISFRREILTPIDDPKVKSQIQQKLNQGALYFDIAKGRVTKKVVQWDEKVQGFEGDDSFLHYVGRYTMDLISESSESASVEQSNPLKPMKGSSGERSSRNIRPRNGKPITRK